jgi:hypothetical protein
MEADAVAGTHAGFAQRLGRRLNRLIQGGVGHHVRARAEQSGLPGLRPCGLVQEIVQIQGHALSSNPGRGVANGFTHGPTRARDASGGVREGVGRQTLAGRP